MGESADLDTLGVLSQASRIVYLIPSCQGRGKKQRGKFTMSESSMGDSWSGWLFGLTWLVILGISASVSSPVGWA